MKTIIRLKFYILIILILFSPACKRSFLDTGNAETSLYSQHQLDSLTLSSLKKVDDYPLYVMTYYGDYGFADYLKTGRWQTADVRVHVSNFACACFSALNGDGNKLFGRSYDMRNRASLLLFTDPPGAYSSLSMVDLSYFGFGTSTSLDSPGTQLSFLRPLLQTPYLPFDGMNEHGLVIGLMAIPHAESPYDPEKITIGEIEIIRLVLDYARNVDEAIGLIKKYNVRMDNPPIHYLISDKTGRSLIIEFVNDDMKIIRNTGPWQVCTNFILSEFDKPEAANCRRYNYLWSCLQEKNGSISTDYAMIMLENVAQPHTMWSNVYDMSAGYIYACVGRQYDNIHRFNLKTGF
ncbi:linear amide C-N hydrolase [candidate division KSB1 bacterium]|nr:linear amide C-N hydrolase [candidate division KSB1 bacterium]